MQSASAAPPSPASPMRKSGVAFGPATVACLRCLTGGSDVLLLFGDVANVAGRLAQEQSGDAASVHVCGRTTQSFAEEQGLDCRPIEVSWNHMIKISCGLICNFLIPSART
jgi:hypothetical protein